MLVLVALCLLIPATSAGTLFSSDFSASLAPFSACNLKAPSTVERSSGNLRVYFDETGFDGTRNDKGAEICVFQSGTTTNVAQMHKEGWQGFRIRVPTSFPHNKNTIIAQQFCPGGCSSWCGTLEIDGNSLAIEHRGSCGTPTSDVVVDNIVREEWHDVVVHMEVSADEQGVYEVWYDGAKVYSASGINVGFGTWNSDDTLETGWYFKNGIYAYDTENYNDATRTLWFDDVKWYETDGGELDGYATVRP